MSPETRILADLDAPVVRITLARPDVRNAFDDVMIVEISRALEAVAERFAAGDPTGAPRALVLTGAGSAFCAGADANWMRRSVSYTREENESDARRMAAMLRLLDELPVPTIARVNGACLGGGMGLVSCCDLVVAVESADFGFTEARLGIAPAVISSFVLPRIGAAAARRYFLTAEVFKAETARTIGLVHEIAPAEALDARVEALVGTILGNGPRAVAAAKRLLRENLALRKDDAIENSVRAIAELRASEEGQEGLSAFLEKRRPAWKA